MRPEDDAMIKFVEFLHVDVSVSQAVCIENFHPDRKTFVILDRNVGIQDQIVDCFTKLI
jgi:hypothetical protein